MFVTEDRAENLAVPVLSCPYTLCSYFCVDFQAHNTGGQNAGGQNAGEQNAGDKEVSHMVGSLVTCFVLQVIKPSQKPRAMSTPQTSISQSLVPTPPHAYTGPNPGLVSSCAISA